MRRTTILNVKEIKRTPLKEAQSAFYKHCRLKNLTEQTLKYYEEDLSYFRSKISVKYADEITQEVFEAFLLQELDAGKKVTSLNSRIRGLRVFFNFCTEREYMKPISVKLMKEVNKYVERVKQYFGANDSEIHVIIASAEWAELLLPFSRFYADAGFSIEGIQIDVSEDNLGFQVQSVSPLPIVQGRFIAPWHNVYWYADSTTFQHGIAAIEHAYQQKGIDDYVIVKFYLPDHYTLDERRAALQMQVANMRNVAESMFADSALNISIPG